MGEPGIYLRQLELGPMQNFVYLVGDPVARECVVVDPAWEIDTIVDTARADGMRLTGALVTHTHQDHVGGSLASWGMPGRIPGVEELLARVPLKVYVHKAEREFLPGLGSDLVQVDNHDTLSIGRLALTFLHTPGHTPGSQCFLVDGRLVSGDTLFIGSCGRTDLPGSDPKEMYYSLTQRLAALPDDTLLFPGHNYGGPSSTIGDEKRQNPFMRFASLGDYTENPFVLNCEAQLLENSPPVLRLFAGNPFGAKPPAMVRAVKWQYWFTTPAERARTGAWWNRKLIGLYAPAISK